MDMLNIFISQEKAKEQKMLKEKRFQELLKKSKSEALER